MPKKKLPDVILIVLDTARAKSFSCYGYHRKTTPNIDRIAEEGVLYKWCFSPANWTIPAHASLFTGLYPSEHGCDERNMYLDETLLFLPEILREAGYYTAAVSCNSLISPELGFAKGFDNFTVTGDAFPFPGVELPSGLTAGEKLRDALIPPSRRKLKWLLNKAIGKSYSLFSSWLALVTSMAFKKAYSLLTRLAITKRRFFLFINVTQTHVPYDPPRSALRVFGDKPVKLNIRGVKFSDYSLIEPLSPEISQALTVKYDAALHYTDSLVGWFLKAVGSVVSLEETLLVITSDHGELLGEYGGLHGHGWGIFPELTHVPLIVSWPTDGLPGHRVLSNNRLVQLHDIYASILDLCDLPFPAPVSSMSLLSSEERATGLIEWLDAPVKLEKWISKDPVFRNVDPCWGQPLKATLYLEEEGVSFHYDNGEMRMYTF